MRGLLKCWCSTGGAHRTSGGMPLTPAAATQVVADDQSTYCEARAALRANASALGGVFEVLFISPASALAVNGTVAFRALGLFAGSSSTVGGGSGDSGGGGTAAADAFPYQLPRGQNVVRLTFACFWGGRGGLALASLTRDVTLQHMAAQWLYAPPKTVQSTVQIGTCAPPQQRLVDRLEHEVLRGLARDAGFADTDAFVAQADSATRFATAR